MNILLINHYAGSSKHGMEFRPYYLAREWVASGHRVQIMAGSYSHIRAKQPALSKGIVTHEIIDGVDYCWLSTPTYSGNGVGRVKSMLSFIWHLWRKAKQIALDFKPDVVIASSTYPMDIWPAKRIAKLAEAKLIYEVHDLWPLSPMELGGMTRKHPFIMWVQYAEDYAYKHADKVISMLPKTLEYMVSRGMAPEKWAYVPNGVDLAEWHAPTELAIEVQSALDIMKTRGLPIVGYTGTHGLANALDVLVDAAELLKGQAQVLLVGTGPERDRLFKRVVSKGLDNVVMLPSVPKTSIPKLLEQIDIAYIGWHPNPLYRFGISPNKLMDYMMAGKPIVHSVKAGNDPVMEVGCGLTVLPGDPKAIAFAIEKLIRLDRFALLEMGSRGKRFVTQHRTYPILADQFLKFCK